MIRSEGELQALACGDRLNCGAAAGHGALPGAAAAASHRGAAVSRLLCAALVPALPLIMNRHVAHFKVFFY